MNVDGCEIDPKFIIHDDVLVLVRSHNICYLFRLSSHQLEVFTQKCKSCDFRQKAHDTYVMSILERFTFSGWKYGHSILSWFWRLISDLPAEDRITRRDCSVVMLTKQSRYSGWWHESMNTYSMYSLREYSIQYHCVDLPASKRNYFPT